MNITSIISEYNPFHEGHKFHMEMTKKITNADYTIVIMSGNFTQRGTPAIINKYARTRQALLGGADLVLELPVCFASASAEGFAFGAISILDKLGVINSLVFGSECGDIHSLKKIADFLTRESEDYQENLQFFLKQGVPFPKARANALSKYFPDLDGNLLSSSNNILGIEYCRALNHFHSSIQPMTIKRIDNYYNEPDLSENGKLSSATSIRNFLTKEKRFFSSTCYHTSPSADTLNFYSFDILEAHMPKQSLDILKENWGISTPITSEDISPLLKYKLLLENRHSLTNYLDVNQELSDRIYNCLNQYKDFDSFCELLKTKELTYSRISRSLLHILLDLKKYDYEVYKNNGYGQYARILGFRKCATPLLHEIKKNSSIPLISKLSDAAKDLDGIALSMLEKDIQATHIYESVVADKFHCEFKNEFQRQLVII